MYNKFIPCRSMMKMSFVDERLDTLSYFLVDWIDFCVSVGDLSTTQFFFSIRKLASHVNVKTFQHALSQIVGKML